MGKFKNFILTVLFTRRCMVCDDICSVNQKLCRECNTRHYRITGEICYKCGMPKAECICNNNSFKFFMSVCAPFYYKDGPAKAVRKLKFNNNKSIVNNITEEMADQVLKRYSGCEFDYCTFVPMYKKDEKAKGYNHARLLAEELSQKLAIPCYPLLKKDIRTNAQHNTPAHLRKGNVAAVFSYNQPDDVDITDSRILLCDDVLTTGTTLNECTKVLLFNNAAEVRCVTACITKRNAPR